MNRESRLVPAARETLRELERSPHQEGLLKQIRETLGLLETDPRHPSLQTHKYRSLRGSNGEEVFEAYVQNQTPAAYRVFFYYGPDRLEGKRRDACADDCRHHPSPIAQADAAPNSRKGASA